MSERESSLDRASFLKRLPKASAMGILGLIVGSGGEAIRQVRENASSSEEPQTRGEMLRGIDPLKVMKAGLAGGSIGTALGFTGKELLARFIHRKP